MNASTLASRRWFLQRCGVGLGAVAAHTLLADRAWASPGDPLAPKPPHYPARAKNVIFLFMAGGPSHLELFDHKPQLAKFSGTLPPPDLIKGYRAAFINPNSKLLGPKFAFSRHGACGAELSELLPHLATVVDEIAIVKSMVTDAFNHAPAQIMMNTGSPQFGRPSRLFIYRNDILDATGTAEELGKTPGKDAAAGKATYVSLYGLERARELADEARGRVEAALAALDADTSVVRELVATIRERRA